MHVSLSEVQTTICKATVAVGLPLGLGEEAGRAARCMMASGVGSLAAFVNALDALEEDRSTGFNADQAIAGTFRPKMAVQLLSALRAGPSACDLVVSAASTNMGDLRITLNEVDVPIVILFQVLASSTDVDKSLYVAWNMECKRRVEVRCWQGTLTLVNGVAEDLLSTNSAKVSISLVEPVPRASAITANRNAQHDANDVDEETWRRIEAYADRLLLNSTGTSRLTGAGAGVIDLD